MKIAIVLAAVLSLALAERLDLSLQWNNFKVTYNKSYSSSEEEDRIKIFVENLKKIENHNALYEAGLESYYLGINEFADMTDEEFEEYLSFSGPPPQTDENAEVYTAPPGFEAPASLDWRQRSNTVNPVRHQGACGSCWAFSSAAALESVYAIKSGQLLNLSPQNLVDCSKPYGTTGCKGGWPHDAYKYVRDKGIELEKDYPYEGKENVCRAVASKSVLKIKGPYIVPSNEDTLKDAVASLGPTVVSLDAKEWKLYHGGIFDAKQPFKSITHAVVAIGYGSEGGKDYWILRNSWGPGWGEQGHLRVSRNTGDKFGVTKIPTVPQL